VIHWFGNIAPSKVNAVAVSGGIDSMVLVDFLVNAGHKPDLLFYHHNTETSDKALEFLLKFSSEKGLNLITGRLIEKMPKGRSLEDWWREKRYEFFSKYYGYIALGHHLNDAVETWLFNCIHGNPGTIQYKRGNLIVRPLLVTSKEEIIDWAKAKDVDFVEDKSNMDQRFSRNRIRHSIVPEALKVNPGIEKVVKKMIISS
jgi:tRNA(Ile)-lysidine synthase